MILAISISRDFIHPYQPLFVHPCTFADQAGLCNITRATQCSKSLADRTLALLDILVFRIH